MDCVNLGGYCKFDGPAVNGMRPGNCSAEVPVDNGAKNPTACIITQPPPEVDFKCFNEGKMIDPTDCKKYIMCQIESPSVFKAESHACPDGKMYNIEDKDCNIEYSEESCKTVMCDKEDKLPKPFPGNDQYWTKCIEKNGGFHPIVGSSPDGTVVDFKSESLPPSYTFICDSLGFYANSLNPTKYFHCSTIAQKYVAQELDCEPGKTFKENTEWGAWFSCCQ